MLSVYRVDRLLHVHCYARLTLLDVILVLVYVATYTTKLPHRLEADEVKTETEDIDSGQSR